MATRSRTIKAAKTATPTATPSRVSFAATASIDLEATAADGTTKLPTFAIRGYTGAAMNVAGFSVPVIVDLAGLKADSQTMPALLDHDTGQIVGQTDSVSISKDGVDLTGTVMGEDAASAKVLSLARNGFKWQASIGANIARQEFLKSGEKAVVNGRDLVGPMLIARDARLYEITFTALGADSQTSAAVAAKVSTLGLPSKGESTMQFEKWLEAKGFDPAATSDTQATFLRAMYDQEQAGKNPPVVKEAKQPIEDILAKHRAEQDRIDRITELTAAMLRERPMLVDELEQISAAAIEAKTSVQEYEIQLLRIRANIQPGRRRAGRHESRSGPKVLEAAICMAGRLENPEKAYDEATLHAADEHFPHGVGLQDMLLMVARENGYAGSSARDVRGLLEYAFRRDIRAEFSTMSLPGILSNVANKFLMRGFMGVESSWRTISTIKPVKDFKTNSYYSLTGDMEYAQIGPTGELKHGTVDEIAYTNKANTYGKMFAITREAIINDDLGALTEIPQRLGRGAALKLNKVFWTAFLSNANTFFTSGRGNLNTGAGSALSFVGLSAADVAFRKQTDPDGQPLGLTPKILLVPVELATLADQLMTAMIVNTGGASTLAQVPNINVWANKYVAVSSSYLSNANIPGFSASAWYLLANPDDLPAMLVSFLNGRETPIVEQADADFNVLGIQMRGYHDFGVSQAEYRAVVKSAGS